MDLDKVYSGGKLINRIFYYRVRREIKKFSKIYRERKLSIWESEVIKFYDALSRFFAYFFTEGSEEDIDYLIKIGNLLIDETRNIELDFIYVIPLIHLEIFYIILDKEDYSDVVEKLYNVLSDDEGMYFLVKNTIEILERDSLEDAVASSSGMLLLGIDSYFNRDPETALKVIGYYILLTDILSTESEENYVFSLISYFSLSLYIDIIRRDQEFIEKVDRYGDDAFSTSFIAVLVESTVNNDKVKNHLNKKLGEFIRSILDADKEKLLMKESLALRWYFHRVKKSRYKSLLDNVARIVTASIKVLRGKNYSDIEKAEEVYNKKLEDGSLTEGEKDLLAVAALELYKAGLKTSYDNIINFLHSVGKRNKDKSLSTLADILKNIQGGEGR